MRKRWSALVSAVLVAVTLGACGGSSGKPGDDPVLRAPSSTAKPSSGDGY